MVEPKEDTYIKQTTTTAMRGPGRAGEPRTAAGGRARAFASLAAVLSVAACAATRLGASEAAMTTGRDRASAGATVFQSSCARCHGDRGEGLSGAPAVLGPGALPEYPRDMDVNSVTTDPQQLQIQQQTRPQGAPVRDPFRTAADLVDFVKNHLPKPGLKSEDSNAVATFLLVVQGADVPATGLTADNAASVRIPH
jgi:mono/diheme cytochrome c family protein